MYDKNYVLKILEAYESTHGRATVFLLRLLKKSRHDLYFLFQLSQGGWECFKKLTKDPFIKDQIDELELCGQDSAIDYVYKRFFAFLEDCQRNSRLKKSEGDYLTSWFSECIVQSGRNEAFA